MNTLSLVVELEIKPEHWDAFLARAKTHRNNVFANEAGVDRFDILVSQDTDHTVYLYEAYADQAALDLHFSTAYLKEYIEDTGPWIAKRKRTLCAVDND